MSTPSPEELAERRATVARLSHDGASLRAIAEQLGISKDTAGRDLKAWERDSMRQPDQQDETPATAAETAGATDATPCETAHATDATATATAAETPATPALVDPAVGHWLSLPLPVDDEFLEDLAVLTRCGRGDAEAIGHAVRELANAYRGAWAAGAYPSHTEPRIQAFELAPYRPPLREDETHDR